MKFILTGGVTGGHFYPLIATAQSLNRLQAEKKIKELELFFLSTNPYSQAELDRYGIKFRKIVAGKLRVYFSVLNFLDIFKTAWGCCQAVWQVFVIYPDAVFSKGGFAAWPVVLAARLWRIPVLIHESDTIPGRVNRWSARFARVVFLSFEESQTYFSASKTTKVTVVGRPVRREILEPDSTGAREYLHLEENRPVLLILGGSQGADKINNLIVDLLTELLPRYYIIHQTGAKNFQAVKQAAKYVLADRPELAERYKPFGYLDDRGLKMSAALADLVISRAGSGLFEIAAWGRPSILIPLPQAHGEHQLHNARVYSEAGACLVIEENNLKASVFLSEFETLMNNEARLNKMAKAAREFFTPRAAEAIAKELVEIGEEHER